MLKKNHFKKIFVGAAALVLILLPIGIAKRSGSSGVSPSFTFNIPTVLAASTSTPPVTPNSQKPQIPNLLSCAGNVATCGVYFIAFVANNLTSVGVALGAALIRFGLQLNDNVFNSPAVQTGFSVMLAIANLGFVLCIIIIALATILRSQTYGMKQLLWKLVVMAVLVNFGLVVTAPIVGFADSMTNYFVNATSPSAATGGYEGYVTIVTSAFAPQQINANPPATTTSEGGITGSPDSSCGLFGQILCSILSKVATQVTQAPDIFLQQVNAMIFGIIFSSLTAFTFLCIGILLFVRYLMLAGLLIVLPIAWLTFIIPKYDSSFSKWWSNFIKWTLFPPAALFFIYLAMITISNIPGTANTTYLNNVASVPAGAATGPEGALVYQTGLAGPIQNALDEYLLVGLTIMGLFFANSLTGKAGAAVVDGAKSASKAVGGYVGKKSKRWVGDRVRTAGRKYNPETRETTSALQRFGASLQGVPGLKRTGSIISNYTSPRAVEGERKEDVEHYIKDNLTNLTNDGIKARATSKTAFLNPTVAAALAQELARRDLTNDREIAPLMEKYVDYAEKIGNAEEIFKNRPDLMEPRMLAARPAGPGGVPPAIAARLETKDEAIARAVASTKGDVIHINSEIFNYADPASAVSKLGLKDHHGAALTPAQAKDLIESAILKLSTAQLGVLGSDTSAGSQARHDNINDAIRDIINTKYPLLKKAVLHPTTNQPTGKYEFDDAALANYINTARANGASKNQLDGINNLKKIANLMKSNFNWVDPLS